MNTIELNAKVTVSLTATQSNTGVDLSTPKENISLEYEKLLGTNVADQTAHVLYHKKLSITPGATYTLWELEEASSAVNLQNALGQDINVEYRRCLILKNNSTKNTALVYGNLVQNSANTLGGIVLQPSGIFLLTSPQNDRGQSNANELLSIQVSENTSSSDSEDDEQTEIELYLLATDGSSSF